MPRPGRMTTDRAKDFKGSLLRVAGVLGPHKFTLAAVILFAVGSTVFSIVGPKVLAKATTALAIGFVAKLRGTGGIDFGYIGRVLLVLLAMYLVSALFSLAQQRRREAGCHVCTWAPCTSTAYTSASLPCSASVISASARPAGITAAIHEGRAEENS